MTKYIIFTYHSNKQGTIHLEQMFCLQLLIFHSSTLVISSYRPISPLKNASLVAALFSEAPTLFLSSPNQSAHVLQLGHLTVFSKIILASTFFDLNCDCNKGRFNGSNKYTTDTSVCWWCWTTIPATSITILLISVSVPEIQPEKSTSQDSSVISYFMPTPLISIHDNTDTSTFYSTTITSPNRSAITMLLRRAVTLLHALPKNSPKSIYSASFVSCTPWTPADIAKQAVY